MNELNKEMKDLALKMMYILADIRKEGVTKEEALIRNLEVIKISTDLNDMLEKSKGIGRE